MGTWPSVTRNRPRFSSIIEFSHYLASLVRYGKLDNVVVVARRGAEVIYWEDVEIGFNLSSVANDGTILENWCNQDDLGLALNCWIKGRTRPPNVGLPSLWNKTFAV